MAWAKTSNHPEGHISTSGIKVECRWHVLSDGWGVGAKASYLLSNFFNTTTVFICLIPLFSLGNLQIFCEKGICIIFLKSNPLRTTNVANTACSTSACAIQLRSSRLHMKGTILTPWYGTFAFHNVVFPLKFWFVFLLEVFHVVLISSHYG